MPRKCVRFKKTAGGKRCEKFSGKATKKAGGKKRSSKGRCLKWSKGRSRCMKRAK